MSSWIDQQIMVYVYNKILLSSKKNELFDTYNMD